MLMHKSRHAYECSYGMLPWGFIAPGNKGILRLEYFDEFKELLATTWAYETRDHFCRCESFVRKQTWQISCLCLFYETIPLIVLSVVPADCILPSYLARLPGCPQPPEVFFWPHIIEGKYRDCKFCWPDVMRSNNNFDFKNMDRTGKLCTNSCPVADTWVNCQVCILWTLCVNF